MQALNVKIGHQYNHKTHGIVKIIDQYETPLSKFFGAFVEGRGTTLNETIHVDACDLSELDPVADKRITAHELARALLAGPDVPVTLYDREFGGFDYLENRTGLPFEVYENFSGSLYTGNKMNSDHLGPFTVISIR